MNPGQALGAQSFSFRKFDLAGSIDCLQQLGLRHMEFCGVHFPADPAEPGFQQVVDTLRKTGVACTCFGVEGFNSDAIASLRKFEFARAMGVEVLTADPAPESFETLDKLTEQYGIKIGIHNHGPGARYDKAADTIAAIKDHSPLIGACVDTGHVIRSGEKPEDVIEQLGARVISLHLKDWKIGGDETILGEGDLDLEAVARALRAIDFTGPIMMEYENSPENPVPEMRIGLENWRAVY